MVGNYERLAELTEEAANSEDAALIQQLKTMDSLQAKMNQLKVTFQEFYTSTGVEDLIKWTVDGITNIISRLNDMPKVFGKLPVAALATVVKIISGVKAAGNALGPQVVKWFTDIKSKVQPIGLDLGKEYAEQIAKGIESKQQRIQNATENVLRGNSSIAQKAVEGAGAKREEYESSTLIGKIKNLGIKHKTLLGMADIAGTVAAGIGAILPQDIGAGAIDDLGTTLAGAGQVVSGAARIFAGDITGLVSIITGAATLLDGLVETTTEKVERLENEAKKLNNEALLKKNEYTSLKNSIEKINALKETQFDSVEATEEYKKALQDLANTSPELISGFDTAGNAIVDITYAEDLLAKARKESYDAAIQATQKEIELIQARRLAAQEEVVNKYSISPLDDTLINSYFALNKNLTIRQKIEEAKANLFGSYAGDLISSGKSLDSLIAYYNSEKIGFDEKTYLGSYINARQKIANGENSSNSYLDENSITFFESFQDFNNRVASGEKIPTEEFFEIVSNVRDFVEKNPFNELSTGVFQDFLKDWGEIAPSLQQIEFEKIAEENAKKRELGLRLQRDFYTDETAISESVELESFLQENIYKKFLSSGLNSIEQYLTSNYSSINSIIEEYSLFWNNLNDKQVEFQKVLNNASKYTLTEYQEALKSFGLTEENDIYIQAVAEAEEAQKIAIERYTGKLKQLNLGNNEVLTSLTEKIAWGLLDNVAAQIEKAQKISPTIVPELEQLYSSEKLTTEAKQIIANADLFSLTGYIDVLQELKDKGIEVENIIPTVTEWFKEIPINLEAELNSFAQNTSSKMKDMVESLDNAVSGMDFEDAVSFAQKMGLTLADLEQRDGQFFYDNLVEIKDYYFKEYDELKKAISDETERQKVAITNNSIFKGINENTKLEDIESLPEELKSLFTLYFDEWKNLEFPEGEIKKDFASYVQNQLDESYTANVSAIDEYKQIMLSRFYVEIGDIENAIAEALTRVKLKRGQTLPSVADIEAAIRAGDISSFAKNVQASIFPLVGLINEAIKNSLTDTWNLVLDGFESPTGIITTDNKLIIEELEKLAPSGIVEKVGEGLYKIVKEINESELIKELKTLSNGDYTKFNEYYSKIKSLQKYRGGGKDAKQEALGELIENANKLEEETLENIANDLGTTIPELTKYLSQNADGEWIATASDIQEIIKKENIEIDNQLKDQLQERFNDIISMVSNGISGSASFQEIEIIQNSLNDAGLDIELKTFKTAEGLKYTEESVYEIYYALSQINAVAAQNLLEGISEQMEEWEGRGVDIATIYGKIGEAQKKIKDLEEKDPNDSRLRLAKAELATLQQIAKEKSKDEDNFDFMNKDLGDLNNPLTFYDSSAKAFEAIGEAASTGYMDIEAYVNMINFAADMYAKAGQNFEVLGMSASEAIQAGFAAIEGVDGEAKIKMSGLTFGTEELTEGMEFGIEEMAKSQIEWIDAQIAMLKGIETVQNLGELDKPTATNNVADFIDNYIGNFSSDENYQGLKKEIEILQEDADNWAEFCSKWQEILDKNDPATMEQEIIALFSVFDINLLEYIIPESEYDLVYNKVAEIFDPKNLYKKVVNADNAGETAEALAKSLGLNKEELLTNLQQAIEASGGSITAEELINLIVKNFEISQDELGNLVATIKINAEAGETIEEEDLLTRKEIIQNNKQQSLARGINSTKINDKTDNDKGDAEATVGTLTITAEKAVLGNEDSETEESGFDTIVPEGIAETTTAIETGLTHAISSIGSTAEDASGKLEKARVELGRIRSVAGNLSSSKIQKFANAVNSLNNGGTKLGILGSIVEQINKLPTSPRYVGTASASGNVTTPPSSSLNNSWDLNGNGIVDTLEEWQLKESMVKGNALAAGTLMGELGPELVVSGGRYYVVGQNGAEFVNLPSDAIVFNHLQTKRLLESGHINSTGDPVTNERNAVAWATGNVNGGPAMASASDVIAQLLELRAFWQGILEMSTQDFAKAGGGGKGGGGGGEDNKAYVADLERWYNLLRQIANLEQKITLEQAKRQNMTNGYDYVDSLENELDQLKRQEKAYRDLSALQKSYYDTRRQDLLNSDYSKIFTYTSDGLMQYHEGENIGFDILAKLQETDANGQMKMNATEQLAYLASIGFDTSVLKVTKEGEDVDSETEMVQNFFDNVQAWMDELDGLYDSYNEALINVEEAIAAQTAIQQEYIDNQLSLEQQVYTAIIDREQAAIDAAQDEIDAIQEAADNFISGLNDTLKREKDMYQTNNEQAETERLQRQLAILQRSGGSASEIRALEEQLESRYQDAYFDSMQDQIDAIQQASENQIEKLQEQVDIAVEALEYQKANGLLWNEVYEIMNNWDANAITQFVMEFTKAFKEQSTLQNQEQAKETQMSAEKWDAAPERQKQTEMWNQYFKQATEQYGQTAATNAYSSAKEAYDKAYQATEGTVEQKHAAGMAAAKIEFEKSKAEIDKVISGVNNGGGGNSSGETYPYGKVSEISRKETNVLTHEGPAIATIKYALKKLGYYKGEINEKYGTEVYNALIAFQKANKLNPDGIVGEETKKAFKLKGYSLGGLVDYTGLAMVHGTPQKPESYLNAEQTQELRNLLDEARTLNNVSHSISNLNRLRQAWQTEFFNQISSKEQSNQDTGDLIFEDVDINITSGVINNQAEAAQLGRTMWNEFINVAKKTGNLTLSRR